MGMKVTLVDVNRDMVEAWRHSFADFKEVSAVHGSMLDQDVDAWVSPTNAQGNMDGGLDLVIKNHLGAGIQKRVHEAIAKQYGGVLAVGFGVCVPTGRGRPAFLVSTPTMVASGQNVSHTFNAALACGAALQAVALQNARAPGSIASVAMPGFGASTGGVPPETCADLMRVAYQLLKEERFATFEQMRAALEARLEDVAPLMGFQTPSPSFGADDLDDEEFE